MKECFQDKNILVGISCIPKNLDKNFLNGIFEVLGGMEAKNLLILCADTLQRYSHIAFNNYSSGGAYRISKKNGELIQKLIHLACGSFPQNYRIINWDDFSHVGRARDLFCLLYEKIASFRSFIDKISLILYNERNQSIKIESANLIRKKKFENIKFYFFEEILAATRTVNIDHNIYNVQIYPVNNENDVSFTIMQLMQKEFNDILEFEIIPFLHKVNMDFHPDVMESLNKLDASVKLHIFESERTNFFVMFKSGRVRKLI